MDIDVFTWVIREPLRSRPVVGLIYGALTGGLFAVIVEGSGSELAATTPIGWGYVIGWALGGLIVGACLPLFRHRLLAGIVVSAAAGVGLFIIGLFSNDYLAPEFAAFAGCSMGLIYGVLLWSYDPRGRPTKRPGD